MPDDRLTAKLTIWSTTRSRSIVRGEKRTIQQRQRNRQSWKEILTRTDLPNLKQRGESEFYHSRVA